MAPRPAIGSPLRVILLAAGTFGLLACVSVRPASAEPDSARAAPAPATATATADPNQALPPSRSVTLDEYPPPAARRNLLLAGIVSTAVWYGGALGTSYAVDDQTMAKDLRIPIAGPWMALTHTGCGGAAECNKILVVLGAIATTLDGLGQAAGLALAGEALFMPTQEPKRTHAALRAQRTKSDFAWRPSFDAGKNTVSFGVLGVF